MLCIPIRYRSKVVGVLTRESAPSFGRAGRASERTYVDVFNRFARMIANGDFPFDADDVETEEAPRVGDGVIVIDASGRVEYSSPNAVSTLHRLGVHANAEGLRFSELGLEETVVGTGVRAGRARDRGAARGSDITVLMRGIPCSTRAWSPARWCCCATSPSCAAAICCCCPRTRRSARSTTG